MQDFCSNVYNYRSFPRVSSPLCLFVRSYNQFSFPWPTLNRSLYHRLLFWWPSDRAWCSTNLWRKCWTTYLSWCWSIQFQLCLFNSCNNWDEWYQGVTYLNFKKSIPSTTLIMWKNSVKLNWNAVPNLHKRRSAGGLGQSANWHQKVKKMNFRRNRN